MVIHDWPTSREGDASSVTWRTSKAGAQFTSPFNGTMQAVEFLAERWLLNVSLPPVMSELSGEVETILQSLAGGVNRVRMMYAPRPVPLGTIRGTPVLAAAAARGAAAISITTIAGKTIAAGDFVSVGGQMVRSRSNAVADGAGLLVVPLVHRIRFATAAGTAVLWDHPTAMFTMPAMEFGSAHGSVFMDAGTFDLAETW